MPKLALDRRHYFSGMAALRQSLPCWSSLHGRNVLTVYTDSNSARRSPIAVRRYVREQVGYFSVRRRCVLIRAFFKAEERNGARRLFGFLHSEFGDLCGFLPINADRLDRISR